MSTAKEASILCQFSESLPNYTAKIVSERIVCHQGRSEGWADCATAQGADEGAQKRPEEKNFCLRIGEIRGTHALPRAQKFLATALNLQAPVRRGVKLNAFKM